MRRAELLENPAMQRVLLFGVLIASACSSSDSDDVDRKRCLRLRDHLVELRLGRIGNQPDVDVAAHRAAMTSALGERFVDRCQQLTSTEVKCSLAADDLQAAVACSKSESK